MERNQLFSFQSFKDPNLSREQKLILLNQTANDMADFLEENPDKKELITYEQIAELFDFLTENIDECREAIRPFNLKPIFDYLDKMRKEVEAKRALLPPHLRKGKEEAEGDEESTFTLD